MAAENQKVYKFNIKDYQELISTIVKVEYKKLPSKHLIDYAELENTAAHVIHRLCADSEPDKYNKSYLSTAVKWAIRNEVRRRYKWYVLRNQQENLNIDDDMRPQIREAVYRTILSADEMAEGEAPAQIKDLRRNPEEKALFLELSASIKEALKLLPQRERELIECKFIQDKKLREISEEFNLSPSRISRIIQSGLNRIRKELVKQNLV